MAKVRKLPVRTAAEATIMVRTPLAMFHPAPLRAAGPASIDGRLLFQRVGAGTPPLTLRQARLGGPQGQSPVEGFRVGEAAGFALEAVGRRNVRLPLLEGSV